MRNLIIRQQAKENGVKLWQIADALGISEPTLTRKLRHELPPEETAMILAIIDKLAEGVKE